MQTDLLLLLIVAIGAMSMRGRAVPGNLASWVIVGLTLFGIYTNADLGSRILFVGADILGPILPYAVRVLWGLTLQPIIHYFTWESPSARSIFAVLPDDELYAAASKQIDTHIASLVTSGFRSRGRVGAKVKALTIVTESLERANGQEWIHLTATLGPVVQPVVMHCSLTFEDGHHLSVSNLPWVDPNPPVPDLDTVRLPSIGDPVDLAAAALTLAAGSEHGAVVATPLDTDLLARHRERNEARQQAEVRGGYQRYDATRDVYRHTLRGAYRMHWVLLPPWTGIIDRRDRERERELLAQMGFQPAPRADTATNYPPQPTRKQYLKAFATTAALIAFIVLVPELSSAFERPTERVLPRIEVPANVVVPDSFAGAVRALEQIVGEPSHDLTGNRNDEPVPTAGVAISMRQDSAAAFVQALQDAFLLRGFYLFRTGERNTSGLETDALAMYPTRDAYVVMRAMETNGTNHGRSTEDVIAWFQREERQYPILFDAIGYDYAGGHLSGAVPDASAFARRFIDFCPDIKAFGPVSARKIGRDLASTREIFCWWD